MTDGAAPKQTPLGPAKESAETIKLVPVVRRRRRDGKRETLHRTPKGAPEITPRLPRMLRNYLKTRLIEKFR